MGEKEREREREREGGIRGGDRERESQKIIAAFNACFLAVANRGQWRRDFFTVVWSQDRLFIGGRGYTQPR